MAKLFSFRFVLFVIFCLFSLAFINTAWVAEDAFITFRSVDNMLAGYGPVWNIGERVQVYTHPLWYILLVIGNFIVHSPYYVALVLNYLCLLGFLYTYARLVDKNKPDTPIQALLVIIILLFSSVCSQITSIAFLAIKDIQRDTHKPVNQIDNQAQRETRAHISFSQIILIATIIQ